MLVVVSLTQLKNNNFSKIEIFYFKQRKLLAVYLHHDSSILTNVFCSQILCSDAVISYLCSHFILWAWDLTSQANKARYVWPVPAPPSRPNYRLFGSFPIKTKIIVFLRHCPYWSKWLRPSFLYASPLLSIPSHKANDMIKNCCCDTNQIWSKPISYINA